MNCLSLLNVFFPFFASWSIFDFFRSFVPITIFSYPDWALSSPSIFGLNDSLEEMFSGRNNLNPTLTKLNVSRKEDLTCKKIKDNFRTWLTRSKHCFYVFKMKISGLRKGNVFFIKAIKPKILGDLIFKYYSWFVCWNIFPNQWILLKCC